MGAGPCRVPGRELRPSAGCRELPSPAEPCRSEGRSRHRSGGKERRGRGWPRPGRYGGGWSAEVSGAAPGTAAPCPARSAVRPVLRTYSRLHRGLRGAEPTARIPRRASPAPRRTAGGGSETGTSGTGRPCAPRWGRALSFPPPRNRSLLCRAVPVPLGLFPSELCALGDARRGAERGAFGSGVAV